MNLKLKRPLAFFDIESTGLNIAVDKMVELAILKVHPNGEEEVFVHRFNPGMPIPPESSAIHGIYDEDVADKPFFKDVAKEILEILADSDLGGFNSNRFDIPLLVEEFLRAGLVFDTSKRNLIDAYRIFAYKERRDLTSAYKFYCNKELVNAHSAEADIRATKEVVFAQVEKYDDIGTTAEELHDFSQEDNDFVDFGRRMVWVNGTAVFNFGKHKGKAVVDVLKSEPSYYNWIMNSDFLLHTKQKLKEIKLSAMNELR